MPGHPVLEAPILQPVMALVLWTFVVWVWLYATRIPALRRAGFELRPERTKDEMNAALPPAVRWKADNYNHLMEQPTLFFAVALALAFAQRGDGWALVLAWVYVGLRVVHSLVQAMWNKIEVRFALFFLSSLALIGMTVAAALAVL